jgi:hypothetical protein
MKVFLLHPDRDFAVRPELRDEMFDAMMSGDLFAITRVWRDRERKKEPGQRLAPTGNDAVLTKDLELRTLWNAMAAGDEFLFEMAKRTVLSSLTDPDAIIYRQRVLTDCLEHPEVIRQLYQLAVEALENERTVGGVWFTSSPDQILGRSVRVLKLQTGVLRRLRQIARQQAAGFRSEGFTRFFAMLTEELADDYLQAVEQHLRELEFKRGVFESAELGKGLKGLGYVVRTPREQRSAGNSALAHAGQRTQAPACLRTVLADVEERPLLRLMYLPGSPGRPPSRPRTLKADAHDGVGLCTPCVLSAA